MNNTYDNYLKSATSALAAAESMAGNAVADGSFRAVLLLDRRFLQFRSVFSHDDRVQWGFFRLAVNRELEAIR